jgi:PAS domain S-box-containing protein
MARQASLSVAMPEPAAEWGAPAGDLAGLPVPAARVAVDGALCQANHDWFALLAPAQAASAAWLELFDAPGAGRLRSALATTTGDIDLILTQGGDNGRYLRVRGRYDPARAGWLLIWADESVSMRADQALGQALMVAHEAREEVENIFDAAAEAMLMVDCGTLRILRSNPAAAQIYGYVVRDLEGRPVSDLVAGSAMAGDFIRLHRDYVPLRFHRRADGSHLAVEIRIRYCLRNGREVAVMTVRDASERTRSAGAQLESDQRYRTVFDGAPFPILLLNTQGSVVDANPAAAALYRFNREEILGQRASALISDDLALLRLFVTRPTFLPAATHVRRDGTRFAAETTVSYIHQRGAQLAILIVRDVTEARETVTRLEEAEERWRFALEGAGDGVWDWHVREGSFYRSPRWGEMLGYTPEESRRLVWNELLHPEDRIRVLEQMDAYLHGAWCRSTSRSSACAARMASIAGSPPGARPWPGMPMARRPDSWHPPGHQPDALPDGDPAGLRAALAIRARRAWRCPVGLGCGDRRDQRQCVFCGDYRVPRGSPSLRQRHLAITPPPGRPARRHCRVFGPPLRRPTDHRGRVSPANGGWLLSLDSPAWQGHGAGCQRALHAHDRYRA